MNISEQLNEIVASRGIKQNFISDKTGWTVDKVSKTLRGERKLTAEELLMLCNILDIDPNIFRTAAA